MIALPLFASSLILCFGAVDLPSIEEAARALIRGELEISKRGTVIQYDFHFTDQSRDFQGQVRTLVPGNPNPTVGEKDGRRYVKGASLGFPLNSPVECLVPLEEIEQLALVAVGVTQLSLVLEGPDDRMEIKLGEKTRHRSQRGKKAGEWHYARGGKALDPAGARVVVSWKKGTLTVAVGGRRVVKEKFDSKATGYGRFSFSSTAGKGPAIQQLLIKGALHPSLPLVLANQNGKSKSRAPVWNETFRAETDHVAVLCPTAQADADRWAKEVDIAVKRFFAIFRAPTGWKQRTTIYVFRYPDVLRSYAGTTMPRSLDRGKVALSMGDAEGDIGVMAGLVIGEIVGILSRTLPEWWELGLVGYHRGLHFEGETVSVRPLPDEIRVEAREALETLKRSGFAQYLKETAMVQQAQSLSRAWLHFLLEHDDGAHRSVAIQFYRAIGLGQTTEQAVEEVFPAAVLDALYPKFTAFLE